MRRIHPDDIDQAEQAIQILADAAVEEVTKHDLKKELRAILEENTRDPPMELAGG